MIRFPRKDARILEKLFFHFTKTFNECKYGIRLIYFLFLKQNEYELSMGVLLIVSRNFAILCSKYLVDLNKKSRNLLDLIGEKVKAQGAVTQTKDGGNRISVTKFEVLDYEETYEADAYYQDDEDFEDYDYYTLT